MTLSIPSSFTSKKQKILASLAVPDSEYDDLSPKGSVDVGIRELIDEINSLEGCVTTSSCAGRISVFLEGRKRFSNDGRDDKGTAGEQGGYEERTMTTAGVGGKGGGGRWLYVSHDPVNLPAVKEDLVAFLGMVRGGDGLISGGEHTRDRRLIHFKFEPMILHVLTASLSQAQIVLSAALQAGFRESGALNLTSASTEPPTPMVGIRSMGLALESLVGFEEGEKEICNVPESYLKTLVEISNERFVENTKRIERFRALLKERSTSGSAHGKGKDWEDADVRRDRMRAEGLKKSLALKNAVDLKVEQSAGDDLELGFPDDET